MFHLRIVKNGKMLFLKKSLIISIILCVFLILSPSCTKKENDNPKDFSSNKIIDTDIYARANSIAKNDTKLCGVYTDEKTLGLKRFEIDENLANEPSISFIDKVGNELKSSSSDKYIYIVDKERESLIYKDQKTDTKRILKYIVKNIDKKNWTIYPQNISPTEYAIFEHNNKVYLIYYEDSFSVGLFENNMVKKINSSLVKNSKELYNLKISKIDNIIKIYFTNENGELLENTYKIGDKDNIEFSFQKSDLIDTNIKNYDVNMNNEYKSSILYYKESDSSLNFYRDGKKEVVGYFNDIYALHLIELNNKLMFCLSIMEQKREGEEIFSYPFLFIYPKEKSKKKIEWLEKEFFSSEIPILSISSLADENNLYILTGSNSLTLIKIDRSKFNL